jgi:Uma2 family endonuclease
MLPVLENPEFRKRALPLSVEAWHALIAANLAPQRSELIRGVILEKMSGSFLHTKLSAALLELLQQSLGPEWWVRKEDPLTFSDSEPEADLSVVAGSRDDYHEHPTTAALVVEIAVSSLAEDREMASLYASAGVQEFWIVNASARTVEVYRHPAAGAYQEKSTVTADQILHSPVLPTLAIPGSMIFG